MGTEDAGQGRIGTEDAGQGRIGTEDAGQGRIGTEDAGQGLHRHRGCRAGVILAPRMQGKVNT